MRGFELIMWPGPMRGLKKTPPNGAERHKDKQMTWRLYDWVGPVGPIQWKCKLTVAGQKPIVYIMQLAVHTGQSNWICRLGRYLMATPVSEETRIKAFFWWGTSLKIRGIASLSLSVELVFAQWFENVSVLVLVTRQSQDIELTESLAKIKFAVIFFLVRML